MEYPVKQTVAVLRNKIETKLNGSIPVRGYMTASGQILRPEPAKPNAPPLNIPKSCFFSNQTPPDISTCGGDESVHSTFMNLLKIDKTDQANVSNVTPAKIPVDKPLDIMTEPMCTINDDVKNAIGATVDNLQNAVFGAKTILTQNDKNARQKFEPNSAETRIYSSSSEKMRAEKAKFLGMELTHLKENDPAMGKFCGIKSPTPPKIPPPPFAYLGDSMKKSFF